MPFKGAQKHGLTRERAITNKSGIIVRFFWIRFYARKPEMFIWSTLNILRLICHFIGFLLVDIWPLQWFTYCITWFLKTRFIFLHLLRVEWLANSSFLIYRVFVRECILSKWRNVTKVSLKLHDSDWRWNFIRELLFFFLKLTYVILQVCNLLFVGAVNIQPAI